MDEHIIVFLAGIGILSIACQWFAWWVKLPAILFLLLAGLIVGPMTGWLDPDKLFGHLLFPFIELSVAVILFEGSLSLKLDEIKGLEKVVQRLVSTGVLVTWLIVSLATHLLLGFSWPLSILFGAITVVTGPTVIVPMLRTVRPKASIARILRWEGIIIDPVGALLAVMVFEFIVSSSAEHPLTHTLIAFSKILVIGGGLGMLGGYLHGIILRRHLMPEYLHNVATLTFVVGIFTLSNVLQAESGLLTVTIMGLWLANMKNVPIDDIIDFKESLSVLLISSLFILLAARLDFQQLQALGWGAVGVFLSIQFIARPLKAAVSTWGSPLTWQERALIGWIAPRGIVAAAMAALFSIRLESAGYAEAPLLVPLVFMVIIGTVVLQSATAKPLADWLKVSEPEPKGFLIVGANPLARSIAEALNKNGFQALLADTDWNHIRAALMEGHQTYYGNPVSEHADRNLDLVGIGRLLALSPRDEMNALAALKYKSEFGNPSIFTLAPSDQATNKPDTPSKSPSCAQVLFGLEHNYEALIEKLKKGAKIHSTTLSENFEYADYYKQYYNRGTLLFGIDAKNRLHPATAENDLEPENNWTLLALIEPEAESEDKSNPETESPHSNEEIKTNRPG